LTFSPATLYVRGLTAIRRLLRDVGPMYSLREPSEGLMPRKKFQVGVVAAEYKYVRQSTFASSILLGLAIYLGWAALTFAAQTGGE